MKGLQMLTLKEQCEAAWDAAGYWALMWSDRSTCPEEDEEYNKKYNYWNKKFLLLSDELDKEKELANADY